MNQQKFGVRTWLWIVLAVVIVAALGYIGWYYQFGGKTTPTASPSPTLSATTTSPSPGATATPGAGGGGKTSTPTSNIETKTWEGIVDDYANGDCAPKIKFEYPASFSQTLLAGNYEGKNPYVVIVRNEQSSWIIIDSIRDCQTYQNPLDYFNKTIKSKESDNFKITEGPNETSINGLSAVEWTQADGTCISCGGMQNPKISRTTIIKDNNSKKFISINSQSDQEYNKEAYNVIRNSVEFL